MIDKLLTEHNLEFLSLKGGCRGSSESTLVKMSNCWKSHAAAHILNIMTKQCDLPGPASFPSIMNSAGTVALANS